jgi:hypothetical protein
MNSTSTLDDASWQQEMVEVGSKVLVRFFDCFPLPLSSYIVKEVVQMRLEAHKTQLKDSQKCTICQRTIPMDCRLQFPSCKHWFCEPCFWNDLLSDIDSRESNEAVIRCPCCGRDSCSNDAVVPTKQPSVDMSELTPSERRHESFRRYQLLPEDGHALKSKSAKKKKTSIANSWYASIVPSLGLSRDVRKDKFFNCIERNAIQYVRGCLVAGVDIEWKNEYGQTALYICVWRGYREVATVLIEYGADVSIAADGGSSISSVAKAKDSLDMVELLESQSPQELPSYQDLPPQNFAEAMKQEHDPNMILSTLIPTSSDHPGAGSFLIDKALSSSQVECLLDLCKSLPLGATKKKKAGTLCSDRSYYCDAEGYVCHLLENIIRRVHLGSTDDTVIVFPYMRFLIYSQSGTKLAPHVDLCRVDHGTGLRSTHTFIIYLTSNDSSGETSLLGDVSGEGRAEVLARVTPVRGRLLIYPHACPHEGNEVVDVPKIILRGEVMLSK